MYKYNLHRLSFDLLRFQYFTEAEHFTDKNNFEIFELYIKILQFLIDSNQSIVCEGFFFSKGRKQRVLELENFLEIHFVYLTASLNILEHRLMERYKLCLNSEHLDIEKLTVHQLNNYYGLSIPPNNSELIINTEKLNIAESFIKAESIIQNKQKIEDLQKYILQE